MILEKEAAEQAELEVKIRAKPIPPEVLQPRFHAIEQANFERQMKVGQILKIN